MRHYEGNTVADWDIDPAALLCPRHDAAAIAYWGWKQDKDGKWYRELKAGQKVEDPSHERPQLQNHQERH